MMTPSNVDFVKVIKGGTVSEEAMIFIKNNC